jgi:hypothetical protein
MYKLLDEKRVQRLSDAAIIPMVPGNRDYHEYQKWLVQGNTATPADPPVVNTRRAEALQAMADAATDAGLPPKIRAAFQKLTELL